MESEVAAAASALRAGVSRDALRQLARARAESGRPDPRGADGSLVVPISALAELVGSGVPGDVAARAVAGFVARGGTPGELESLLRPLPLPGVEQAERAKALLRALDARAAPAPRRPEGP